MDGLIFFPWEPCFSLPGRGLGRLPRCRGRWLRRGGSWQGRSDGTARGLKGPSPLAPRYFHHRHPGVTWLSRSLLLPTFESQSQKTAPSKSLEQWPCCRLLTREEIVSHHRATAVGNPLHLMPRVPPLVAASSPLSAPRLPAAPLPLRTESQALSWETV